MAGRSSRSTRPPGPWRTDQPPPRGNLLALVHGGESQQAIEALAAVVREQVSAQAPWVGEPIFADALLRYCRCEARARLLSNYILDVCEQDGPGKVPVRLWESAVASDNAAGKAAVELGLTPMSRASLATLAAAADDGEAVLARLIAEGRQALEERGVLEVVAEPPDDPGAA